MLNNELDCRVDKPNQCQVLGLNKWGRGFETHKKYNDIISYQNGMQIYRPDDGLRVPQRREFLSAEYFDGGCFDWNCPQKKLCPEGKLSGPTPQEQKMFNYFFSSQDPYQLNGGPPQCVGIKGDTANSYLGWATLPNSNKPIWMNNSEQVGSCGEK